MTTAAAATDVRPGQPQAEALGVQMDRATWLLEATWLVLLVAVPAAFDPAGALAFEPVKTSLVRAGVAIAAATWLLRRTARASRPIPAAIGSHPVVRAGLAVIALASVSTLLSLEPSQSFFGTFDRGMGWLNLACGGVALLCIADIAADPIRRERLISALVLGAAIPCGYLLLQRIGRDPLDWTALGTPGSTLASPTFLGGYLVLVAPFAAYRPLVAARSASVAYALWLALALVICTTVVLTSIRGSILGLVVDLIAFGLLAASALEPERSRRRHVALGYLGAVAAALLAAIVLAVTAAGLAGATGLLRFVSIAQLGDSSIERLTVWRDAVALPLRDPLRAAVGFGPETQVAVLEHAEATVRLTQNQQWDRAHNVLLDTWLTQGGLGVLAQAALVVAVAVTALRARRTHGVLAAAILAAVVGHLVEQSFAFESVTSSLGFWVVCGLAASLAPRIGSQPRLLPWLATLGVASAVGLVPLLVTPAVADLLYGQARRADVRNGARLEESAAAWAPWVEELPRAAALDWQHVAGASDRVEPDLLAAAARAPYDPFPQLRLLRWYLLTHNLDAASAACDRALPLGPFRAAVWDGCADVSQAQGRTDVTASRRARAEELRHPR